MLVKIEDHDQLISHILLENIEVVDKVVETKEWKENQVINCEVLLNGIKFDGSILEDTLKHFVKQIEEYYAKKYDADRLDQVIEERAKELLKEHADNALEKIYQLTRKLEESDDLLVPHWDRNKTGSL